MEVEVNGVEVNKKPNSFSCAARTKVVAVGKVLQFSLPNTESNRELIAGWHEGSNVELCYDDKPAIKFNTGRVTTSTCGTLINIRMEIINDE